MLWLDQRHALEAFRASVADEEGHEWNYTIKPAAINSPSNIQSVG